MPAKARSRSDGEAERELRVVYAVGRLDRAIRRELRSRLANLDLTIPQFTTLSVLRARSGLSNAQLARRALVTPQAMNEVIASLEARDLIARNQSKQHQRILEAKLTPEGRRLTVKGDKIVDEVEDLMLDGLSPAGRKTLLKSVRGAVQSLHAGLTDGN